MGKDILQSVNKTVDRIAGTPSDVPQRLLALSKLLGTGHITVETFKQQRAALLAEYRDSLGSSLTAHIKMTNGALAELLGLKTK